MSTVHCSLFMFIPIATLGNPEKGLKGEKYLVITPLNAHSAFNA